MQLDVATYAGFKAYVNAIDNGIEIRYCDTKGREIDREVFTGVTKAGTHRCPTEVLGAQN